MTLLNYHISGSALREVLCHHLHGNINRRPPCGDIVFNFSVLAASKAVLRLHFAVRDEFIPFVEHQRYCALFDECDGLAGTRLYLLLRLLSVTHFLQGNSIYERGLLHALRETFGLFIVQK